MTLWLYKLEWIHRRATWMDRRFQNLVLKIALKSWKLGPQIPEKRNYWWAVRVASGIWKAVMEGGFNYFWAAWRSVDETYRKADCAVWKEDGPACASIRRREASRVFVVWPSQARSVWSGSQEPFQAPSQKSPLPSSAQGPLLRKGDWLDQRQLDYGPRVKANKSVLSCQHSYRRSR